MKIELFLIEKIVDKYKEYEIDNFFYIIEI